MTRPEPDTVLWAAPARRAIAKELPEAAWDGVWSARRATYRVLYRIDDEAHAVVIEAIRHRRTAYR